MILSGMLMKKTYSFNKLGRKPESNHRNEFWKHLFCVCSQTPARDYSRVIDQCK